MTTVSRFSRQNDADLHALNIVLWENLVLLVVLVLESRALYYVEYRGAMQEIMSIVLDFSVTIITL